MERRHQRLGQGWLVQPCCNCRFSVWPWPRLLLLGFGWFLMCPARGSRPPSPLHSDILHEMHQKGELKKALESCKPADD